MDTNELSTRAGAPRTALVTGATQGIGLALVQGLADRMAPQDTVYLTGRNAERMAEAAASLRPGRAQVRTEILDVTDEDATEQLAATLEARHGGVDVVFSNAVMRMSPDDDPRDVVGEFADVSNFGTTRVLRAFAPRLKDGARLIVVASSMGTLHHLAPVLHGLFTSPTTLDEVDDTVRAWRDAVQDGSARSGSWPGFINVTSKIAQVAAVRTLARIRREDDLRRGILLAATCPGLIDTPMSSAWYDTATAPSPEQGVVPLLDLALSGPEADAERYGELVRAGEVLPWGD